MASRISEQSVNVNEVSRISAGTTVKGNISSSNDIRIDGTFEGKIHSLGKVVVGQSAVITGDIVCENADLYGTMHGNFYVKDTLSLKSTSAVEGNLNIRRLSVDLDAKFEGSCRMIDEQEFQRISENAVMAAEPGYYEDEDEPAAAAEPTSC